MVIISELPEPRTNNPHESTWDHHGSYKWGYFADEVRLRIVFFLSQRLNGRNMEIGGGWYLSYPDSAVVDLSSVCLEGNPAEEKLQFDLDELGNGKRLPYGNHSFDSATAISAWQYLKKPEAVLSEVERVLRPGAELYVINGEGAGLDECMVGSSRSSELQTFFEGLGYDTLVEDIPDFGGHLGSFRSVCVAMPDIGLFGKMPSAIREKKARKEWNLEICKTPSVFIDGYTDWEMRNASGRLAKLVTYPVTQYSQDYLEAVEGFSHEYHEHTGGIPLVFAEHTIPPQLHMLTPEHEHFNPTLFLMGQDGPVERYKGPVDQILKRHGLMFSHHINYFEQETVPQLLEYCGKFRPIAEKLWCGVSGNENEVEKLARFIASLGLNSFTSDLQERVYSTLRPNIPDLDEKVGEAVSFGYWIATTGHKQERTIDDLIHAKQRIYDEGMPITGTERLDYIPFLPALRKRID